MDKSGYRQAQRQFLTLAARAQLKAGDVALSQLGSWKITTRKHGGRGPEKLAAYLGKAEPNRIQLHGKSKVNPDKVEPHYSGSRGWIEGKRFGISNTIGPTAQERAGWRDRPLIERNAGDCQRNGTYRRTLS